MKGDLNDYITYRLKRAEITLNDARILAQNNCWNSCVNRLYYACFYAVSALLVNRGNTIKSHNGVRTLFFREYIATGIIDREFSKLFSDLADWRNEGDYADFVEYDEASVKPMIEKTEMFIAVIKDNCFH
jgi:uncharacterized protein (UPF0332 family)